MRSRGGNGSLLRPARSSRSPRGVCLARPVVRDYPGEHCDDFPHRRGGINGGLGVDIPFGRRFFARIQYVTSAIYVYEQIAISHKARLVAGIRF